MLVRAHEAGYLLSYLFCCLVVVYSY